MAAANGLQTRAAVSRKTHDNTRGVRRTTTQRPAPPRASASSAQEAGTEQGPYVVSLRGGRRAAVSYTFDDALRDHSELAAPFLEMFGLKGECGEHVRDDDAQRAWIDVDRLTSR